MASLKVYLKISRPINLIIVGILQYVMYFEILLPVFNKNEIESIFQDNLFFVFILITMIIAGSGNVINDIIDIEIDKLNKPDKWVVGNLISLKSAYIYYFSLISLGAIFSFYIAYEIDKIVYIFIYIFAVLFLYFYSKYLKKTLVLGNVLVSIFSSGVIGVILIFELESGLVLKSISIESYLYIKEVFFGFMIFSFLTTMLREIVKDIEDMGGDYTLGAYTIPIAFSKKKSKYIVGLFTILILLSIIYWVNLELNADKVYVKIYSLIIIIPYLIWILYLLIVAKDKIDFSKLSRLLKFFMLLGMLMLGFYLF